MKIIENEMEAVAVPRRNKNKQVLFNEILIDENHNYSGSKCCLDSISGNEFNENNIAAGDPYGLACVVTQKIHKDIESGNFGHA